MRKTGLLTTKTEAAEQLAVSVRFLEHLIKREDLPVVRFGKAVRVPVAAVEALAARGTPTRRQTATERREETR